MEEITAAIRAHADRLPDVTDARDAVETKIAAPAAAMPAHVRLVSDVALLRGET